VNIIRHRKLWFGISIILIVPGVISLILWGLKPGIDFTGGTELEIESITQTKAQEITTAAGGQNVTVTTSGGNNVLIRFKSPNDETAKKTIEQINADAAQISAKVISVDNVGPAVSRDITKNALIAISLASIAIVVYIAFAFRNAPPPVSPWSFGICAIIAMLHDTLFVIGVFSLLGHFRGVEVDSLFVTAVLTVIGFSVHDTIVVFDRIRENLRRYNKPFEQIVNQSIIETFTRSINTSLTVVITLLALYLFGGASIKHFILALLIGIISGTYSSIFNASPLLVVWNNYKHKKTAKT